MYIYNSRKVHLRFVGPYQFHMWDLSIQDFRTAQWLGKQTKYK